MLAEKIAVGRKIERRAIKRSPVAFNHADYEVQRSVFRQFADRCGYRTGYIDGAVCIRPKQVSARLGANPDRGAKYQSLRVTADESFRKDSHLQTPLRARLTELPQLVECSRCVAEDRACLYHADSRHLVFLFDL